ncbi:PPE domain-containing protein [Mycobacterium sp.]|uniref:PPE domain-containing protein n=1 Tax=Mycobacterium sp. TaxID=1785 RepID=UPI0031E0755B
MPDPRWTGPPEAIAATFEAGSPASVIANNAAWVSETTSHQTCLGVSAVNGAITVTQWQGLGAQASAAVIFGLNAGLQALAGWTAEKIAVTLAAVDAFTVARSSVIPSTVCQANRDEWAEANATNFFGLRTPEIVALDTEYFGEHWPHNSSVGWAYSAVLGTLSAALAVPPPVAPPGASPAGPAAAGEALGEVAAQTGMSDAIGLSDQATQTAGRTASATVGTGGQIDSFAEPLQQLASSAAPLTTLLQAPQQAVQGIAGMPQSLMQTFGALSGPTEPTGRAAGADVAAEPAEASVERQLEAESGGGATGMRPGGGPDAGLGGYTRPAGAAEPPAGGRPTGLRSASGSAEVGGRTASPGAGSSIPLSPRDTPARARAASDKQAVDHARVAADPEERQQPL